MTHIKLCKTDTTECKHDVVNNSITQRIIKWNRDRNNLKFDLDLEVKMLTEEANEFYQAEHLVDRMDAWADFIFVGTGTIMKYLNNKLNYFEDLKEMIEQTDLLSSWMEHQRIQMIELLEEEVNAINPQGSYKDENFVDNILKEVLETVVDANEKKGNKLDANGKVTKHPDFQKPEAKIDNILRKYLGAKYVSPFTS